MRHALSVSLGVAFTVAVAGCTLIATFDTPTGLDGGLLGDDDNGSTSSSSGNQTSSSSSSSGSSTSSSSSSSSSSSTGGTKPDSGTTTTTFPPACDTTVDLGAIDCEGNRKPVCGSSVNGNVADNDLVTCDGNGNATCVQHCATGCADLSGKGLASQCADCGHQTINPTEWYCGKNTKWVTEDADVAYECTDGQYVAGSVATCGTSLCHTVCDRTNATVLPGSCCQNTPDN